LNQQPDRDACTHDAGFAPTDLDIGLDSRECIIQIAHHPLQDLGLLSPAQLREERFDIPKRAHDEAYPGEAVHMLERRRIRIAGTFVARPVLFKQVTALGSTCPAPDSLPFPGSEPA